MDVSSDLHVLAVGCFNKAIVIYIASVLTSKVLAGLPCIEPLKAQIRRLLFISLIFNSKVSQHGYFPGVTC